MRIVDEKYAFECGNSLRIHGVQNAKPKIHGQAL